MNCEIIRDLLPLYAEGLTGQAANREIEDHLAGCEACAKALQQLRLPVEQIEPHAEAWKAAVKKERKGRRRRTVLVALLALLVGAGICLALLLGQDVFRIRQRKHSPDDRFTAVILQGADESAQLPEHVPAFQLKVQQGARRVSIRTYEWAEYQSMHWSPDSGMLAVQYRYRGVETVSVTRMPPNALAGELLDLRGSVESMVRGTPALAWVRWDEVSGQYLLDCSFVCWSEDGQSILISARGTDAQGETRQGYFWYHPASRSMTITDLSGLDGTSQQEQLNLWNTRVKQFRDWSKTQSLTECTVTTCGYKVLSELLVRKAEDCAVTYYRYQPEGQTFAACDADTALEYLRVNRSDYSFAILANGTFEGTQPGQMICSTLYIVVFE